MWFQSEGGLGQQSSKANPVKSSIWVGGAQRAEGWNSLRPPKFLFLSSISSGFSSMEASGDSLTWWIRAPKLYIRKEVEVHFLWRHKPCSVPSITSVYQDHHNDSLGIKGKWHSFTCWCLDVLNHHIHSQVQIKTHTHTEPIPYKLSITWVSWIFTMIQICF